MISPDDSYEPFDVGDVAVINEVDGSLLCRSPEGMDFWVPKTVVHGESEVKCRGDQGLLVVHRWWAESHGF